METIGDAMGIQFWQVGFSYIGWFEIECLWAIQQAVVGSSLLH